MLLRTPRLAVCAALLAVALLSVALCARADARCGDRRSARPAQTDPAVRPPLIIGDSVLYAAVPLLAAQGYEANAMVCRRMDQGLAILRSRSRRGILPAKVIIELGANGVITPADLAEVLALLGPDRRLVWLTPTDATPPFGADADLIRQTSLTTGGRMTVLDWAAVAGTHPGWMQHDHVHIAKQAGVLALVNLIVSGQPWTPPAPLANGAFGAP